MRSVLCVITSYSIHYTKLYEGEHIRAPRTYRGRDIQWWLDAIGVWDETIREVRDIARARREPSLQLIGSPEHRTLDLGVLQDLGVRLTGRAMEAAGDRVLFADDLAESISYNFV